MNTDNLYPVPVSPVINVEQALLTKYPAFENKPPLMRRSTLYLLRKLVREQEINGFLDQHQDLKGFEFVDKVLEHFNFSYNLSHTDRTNIPSSGRVLIVANHPLGALDGLALLKMVGEIRRDVKIIANDLLMSLDPLKRLLLPVDNMGKGTRKADISRIVDTLHNEEAVIVFPAGEVSRAGLTGIRDGRWNSGFLMFARKSNAPILPVYIGGKNSSLFYGISSLNRQLSTLMLPREMFQQHSHSLPMRVGEAIPFSQIDAIPVSSREKSKLLKRHLYRIGKGRKPLFITEKTIAHPQNRQILKQELRQAQRLGETADGKKIYLFDYRADSAVMQEIGRLREVAFRQVGEGTGQKRDLDRYDSYYRHLILWDEDELEIAGAYRLAETATLIQANNTPIYTDSLFRYSPQMQPYFAKGIELGRSFVQPKYWGKRSLDYLWYGIGAYLQQHPDIRYMFGPVSISNSYPKAARDLLVWFYRHYFGDTEGLASSNSPYQIDRNTEQHLLSLFSGNDYKADFRILKEQLDYLGVSVPTLYKQYSEVCQEGGVRFLDFGVDADFGYCVDGLVLVDMAYLKEKKRARYLNPPQ
ncbi:GNAT family N-acyltransferase [Pontibacter sp. JAM-7]|uniref:GNAT family N-acyltransferase n=1 Tax=Pontibacter sp. JAM-7 TaxID=3366581 RepID=UPI003AF66DF6